MKTIITALKNCKVKKASLPKLANMIYNADNNFTYGNTKDYEIVKTNKRDFIIHNLLKGDTELLGAMPSLFLADLSEIPVGFITTAQKNKTFEFVGENILEAIFNFRMEDTEIEDIIAMHDLHTFFFGTHIDDMYFGGECFSIYEK